MAARVLMIQGTASSAGKSLVVAGLCRLYARRGFSVAPFKSQNMALNSFATPDGGEIGRAQALQAEAAGVPPHVEMNPILLKPTGEKGSQVVVLGRPRGVYNVYEYYALKEELWPVVTGALDRLRERCEIVIAEGAGSPAEINIRRNDIANMEVALYARAPVLIVGDIERGGLFAALLGTMDLLAVRERKLVAGYLINKFRGDERLLEPGLELLRERTGRPVFGVLPYLADLHLDEEDSVGLAGRGRVPGADDLEVAVIRLPRMANYTDFLPLETTDGVAVRYVDRPSDLVSAHVVIIPGSKETLSDLEWLHQRGLGQAIKEYAARGGALLGICGGYQMLGETIRDGSRELPGLGLLPVTTWFEAEKRTVQVQGITAEGVWGIPGGLPVKGYEIHMGFSRLCGGRPLFLLGEDGGEAQPEGCVSEIGLVAGTYLHGCFDDDRFREQWVVRMRHLAGLPPKGTGATSYAERRQRDLDRVADLLEMRIGVDRLDGILGL
ncbi:MAG: cobyric acid synthase [Eubacteriales bacterium]|nr:cobyric acid synthase [Pseudomonadota bacterium]MBU4532562.1 cobyric acid synthase [Bacillota bacterium]MBV1728507.1 cobyric acid synthase [Desulforudis sp.]MDP3051183.1 cobyric acid synthase [Eubacteriales bacterium]MDQ7789351.1 cobyric acid synthase [Clostridia bacterium]